MTPRALPKPPAGFEPEETTPASEMLREAAGLMLSSDQKQRLRHADRLFRGSRKEKAEAAAIVTRVKRQLQAGLNETVALARERGEEVEAPRAGPVRVRTRDGLMGLLECQHIDLDEYDRALEVRGWYEARMSGLGSQLAGQEGRTGHDNDAFVLHRQRLAKKANAVAKLERKMAVALASDHNALAMFRAVVANGFSLSSQGKGWAFERNLASLKAALAFAMTFDPREP